MKAKVLFTIVLIVIIVAASLYLRYDGVTHRDIIDTVDDRTGIIIERIDVRYEALDRKLDRIESKLDRLLEIADRPLPDDMVRAQ